MSTRTRQLTITRAPRGTGCGMFTAVITFADGWVTEDTDGEDELMSWIYRARRAGKVAFIDMRELTDDERAGIGAIWTSPGTSPE